MSSFLAAITDDPRTQTQVFIQRGIDRLTQERLSALGIFGKPDQRQLAHDGYRTNIDAFLYATSVNSKVAVSSPVYPLKNYEPTIPLPRPKVLFTLKAKLTNEQLARFKASTSAYGLGEHALSKQTTAYSLSSAPLSFLETKIAHIAGGTMNSLQGYCQVNAAIAAGVLYRIIDLFLRVNSYPYCKTLDLDEQGLQEGLTQIMNFGGVLSPPPDAGDDEDEEMEETMVKTNEVLDITVYSEVLTAKPSPLPSNVNWGAPSEVPPLPGHVFPYFEGLIKGDPQFLRTTCSEYFFRNFSRNEEPNAKSGYDFFRTNINTFAYTPEGMVVQHIFQGIRLALETQTQLYVLMDHGRYLGFCLLGGAWSAYIGRGWIGPVDHKTLASHLRTLWTHDGVIEQLAKGLSNMKPKDGVQVSYTSAMINTPVTLGNALAKIDLGSVLVPDLDKLRVLLKHLAFEKYPYKPLTHENVVWAFQELSKESHEPLPEDIPQFFPITELALFARRDFRILAAFGSRAPSLWSPSGRNFSVPSVESLDPQSAENPETRKKVMEMLVVSSKFPDLALKDWDIALNHRAVRFDVNERSKVSRCLVFKDKNRDTLWAQLRETMDKRLSVETEGPASKKRKVDAPAAGFAFDDLF